MILAMSTTPHDLMGRAISSPFNQPPIKLGDLSPEQCTALARKYELSWGPEAMDALMSLVGGHPYLVRHAMHSAAVGGVSIHEIIAPHSTIFEEFIHRYSERLAQWPELRAVIRDLMVTEEMHIDSPIAMRLEEEGLTTKNPLTQRSRLRYRIFQRLRL
jgi:hypothetical protein